jgi:ribosomal protein S27E
MKGTTIWVEGTMFWAGKFSVFLEVKDMKCASFEMCFSRPTILVVPGKSS